MKNIKKISLLLFALTFAFLPIVNAENEQNCNGVEDDCIKQEVPMTTLNYDTEKENLVTSLYSTNNFQLDDDLTTFGTYDSNTFFMGSNVYDNTNVDGISFIAGMKLNLAGQYDYGFDLGETIDVNGNYEKDLFLAGSIININNGSNLKRDLYAVGKNITINTNIGKNAFLLADTIYLANTRINGNVTIMATKVVFGENVIIDGTFKHNDNALLEGIEKSNISIITEYENEQEEPTEKAENHLTTFLVSFIGVCIVGALLYLLFEDSYKKVKALKPVDARELIKDVAVGFLLLIGCPLLLVLLMFTIIGFPLALVGLLVYIGLIYLTTIYVGYLLGDMLFKNLFKKEVNNYVDIIFGILVIKVLNIIPLIGGLSSFIVTCLGMTLLFKALFVKVREKQNQNKVELKVVEEVKPVEEVKEQPKKEVKKTTTKKTTTKKPTTEKKPKKETK